MNKTSRIRFILAFSLLLSASLARAQSTTSISVAVAAEAALTVTTGTTNLTATGTTFNNYTGTTNMMYYIRTTKVGGTGNIKLQVTTDFGPAGGPSVATPPSTGDALTYSCTVANPGNNGTATPCTNPTTASFTAQTDVAAFGADNRTLKGGNTASINWILTNDPKYQTGTYTATVTFTITVP